MTKPIAPSIQGLIESVANFLPTQSPLESFIHHNTLHHFEDLRFEEACELVAKTRGCEPYLRHDDYINEHARGRIKDADVQIYILEDIKRQGLDPEFCYLPYFERRKLFASAVLIPFRYEADSSQAWLRDTQVVNTKLFAAISNLMQLCEPHPTPVKAKSDSPLVAQVDETMITLCSAFVDQGVACWPMPERERGMLASSLRLMSRDYLLRRRLRAHRGHESFLMDIEKLSPFAALEKILPLIEPDQSKWEELLLNEALSLPGWAGLMHLAEHQPTVLGQTSARATLSDYLTVRVLVRYLFDAPSAFCISERVLSRTSMLMHVYRVLSSAGVGVAQVTRIDEAAWRCLVRDIFSFDDFARRRVLQRAYEHRYKMQFLSALQLKGVDVPPEKPAFQAMFCLDEREESIRRHLEAVVPSCETFGVAGFYGIDMLFVPVGSNDISPRCPIALTPSVIISERISTAQPKTLKKVERSFKRAAAVRKWGTSHSRRLSASPLTVSVGGLISAPMMVSNVLNPAASVRIWRALMNRTRRPVQLELDIVADAGGSVQTSDSRVPAGLRHLKIGYTYEEMATRVEGLLRNCGLTTGFSDLIFVFGHGSTNANNPFWAAYDCGACGGRRGDRNSKIFAWMANNPQVRAILSERGFKIPESTYFVSGIHDTCTDIIDYSNSESIPLSLKPAFNAAVKHLEEACALNAKERSRRFDVSPKISPKAALRHVFERAHSIAEPRPEYGHGSNAASIVGRRSLSRGANLNRRSFLTSYDPLPDHNGHVLEGILRAIIPVVSGISLEYYYSRVDNRVFGCGTKLPHNVTSMVGVMEGHLSDLRTGLPWQTVEIHEPMRLLMIIEQTTEVVTDVLERNPSWNHLFKRGWVQLVCADPATGRMSEYAHETFKLVRTEDVLEEGVL